MSFSLINQLQISGQVSKTNLQTFHADSECWSIKYRFSHALNNYSGNGFHHEYWDEA